MTSRLIVSFIGKADLESGGRAERELRSGPATGPILRLLTHLSTECSLAGTRLMLFDDDRAGNEERKCFCESLPEVLIELGLRDVTVDRHPIALPRGPTDLDALYHMVWHALPSEREQPEEVIFQVSSGTPAMQLTLLLAANCLTFRKPPRLYETSREAPFVRQVLLPYVLAAQERRRDRARVPMNLPETGKKTLLPGTVIDDPHVEAEYAVLYHAATRRAEADVAPAVLILGPSGSGKWHAARQFTTWRGALASEWWEPSIPAGAEESTSVLIRRLDAWPSDALARLSRWQFDHRMVAIAATWRTDVVAAAPHLAVARDGLHRVEQVFLPALSARDDRQALAEAVAQKQGILDGYMKERLQFELLTDIYPRNIRDLEETIAMAASRSNGPHPERKAYIEARQIRDAASALALLHECYRTLAGLKFGAGRPGLEDVLDVMRAVVTHHAQAGGRTQDEVAVLLGCSHGAVWKQLRTQIDLRQWRAHLTAEDRDG